MKALIIGAGIAGTVAALALRKAGIEATICERYTTGAEGIGGVLMIAPNGLSALRTIDAGDVVSRLGEPIPCMVLSDGRGKRFGRLRALPDLPIGRVMWRSELYGALRDRALESCIEIEYGKQLVDADESAAEVTARFADGSSVRADVLLGADGVRSAVRTLIDSAAAGPEYTGLLGFGGYAHGSGVTAEPGTMYFAFGRRAFLGYWAAPDGRIMWFGNLPYDRPLTTQQARAIPAADWLKALRDAYADDVPGAQLVAHARADDLFIAGAGEILPKVAHWHRGRMVLVGDAAHAPSSSSGQGASLAVESAVELARCLRDLPPPHAFAAYEHIRRPRVEKVAADAAKTNSDKAAGPVRKALMSLLMPIAMRTFLTPERMFRALHGHRIDWSAVVGERDDYAVAASR